MQILIRLPKTDADFTSLAKLAQQLAIYHHENLCPDPKRLKADKEWYAAYIASLDGIDIGFVGWHRVYACQTAERAIELQNIFIVPEHRGHGLGFRLVLEVIRDAVGSDCAELKIGVHKDNITALEFYKKLGCTVTDRNDSWRCKLKRSSMDDLLQIYAIS